MGRAAAICATAALVFCARREVAVAPASATGVASPAGATSGAASRLPRGTVRFETDRGPWILDVEVARTPADRARGLMFRTGLEPDHGMLFVFQETEEHSFWMHNTLIALDMIFLGDERTVAGVVANATPRTDAGRTVGKPSRYVVEVAGGEAAAHAIAPGTRAVFVDVSE